MKKTIFLLASIIAIFTAIANNYMHIYLSNGSTLDFDADSILHVDILKDSTTDSFYLSVAKNDSSTLRIEMSDITKITFDETIDKDDNNEESDKTCEEKSTTFNNTNGVKYVDLGLPSGNLWATANLGGKEPEDYGDAYSWGEITTKKHYGQEYYSFYKKEVIKEKWSTKYIKGYTKYVPEDKALKYGYEGFFDNKTTLDLSDDVANVILGGSWRIPTECDFKELKEHCECEWYTLRHVYNGFLRNGYKFTGKNGNWIFLPAASTMSGLDFRQTGEMSGDYWSSSLVSSDPKLAIKLEFYEGVVHITDITPRNHGCSIRAVCPTKK